MKKDKSKVEQRIERESIGAKASRCYRWWMKKRVRQVCGGEKAIVLSSVTFCFICLNQKWSDCKYVDFQFFEYDS